MSFRPKDDDIGFAPEVMSQPINKGQTLPPPTSPPGFYGDLIHNQSYAVLDIAAISVDGAGRPLRSDVSDTKSNHSDASYTNISANQLSLIEQGGEINPAVVYNPDQLISSIPHDESDLRHSFHSVEQTFYVCQTAKEMGYLASASDGGGGGDSDGQFQANPGLSRPSSLTSIEFVEVSPRRSHPFTQSTSNLGVLVHGNPHQDEDQGHVGDSSTDEYVSPLPASQRSPHPSTIGMATSPKVSELPHRNEWLQVTTRSSRRDRSVSESPPPPVWPLDGKDSSGTGVTQGKDDDKDPQSQQQQQQQQQGNSQQNHNHSEQDDHESFLRDYSFIPLVGSEQQPATGGGGEHAHQRQRQRHQSRSRSRSRSRSQSIRTGQKQTRSKAASRSRSKHGRRRGQSKLRNKKDQQPDTDAKIPSHSTGRPSHQRRPSYVEVPIPPPDLDLFDIEIDVPVEVEYSVSQKSSPGRVRQLSASLSGSSFKQEHSSGGSASGRGGMQVPSSPKESRKQDTTSKSTENQSNANTKQQQQDHRQPWTLYQDVEDHIGVDLTKYFDMTSTIDRQSVLDEVTSIALSSSSSALDGNGPSPPPSFQQQLEHTESRNRPDALLHDHLFSRALFSLNTPPVGYLPQGTDEVWTLPAKPPSSVMHQHQQWIHQRDKLLRQQQPTATAGKQPTGMVKVTDSTITPAPAGGSGGGSTTTTMTTNTPGTTQQRHQPYAMPGSSDYSDDSSQVTQTAAPSLWSRFLASFLPVTVYNTSHTLTLDDVSICGYIIPFHLSKMHAYSNTNYIYTYLILTLLVCYRYFHDQEVNRQQQHQQQQQEQGQQEDQPQTQKPEQSHDNISSRQPLPASLYQYLPRLPLLTLSHGTLIGDDIFPFSYGGIPQDLFFPQIYEILRLTPSFAFADSKIKVLKIVERMSKKFPQSFYDLFLPNRSGLPLSQSSSSLSTHRKPLQASQSSSNVSTTKLSSLKSGTNHQRKGSQTKSGPQMDVHTPTGPSPAMRIMCCSSSTPLSDNASNPPSNIVPKQSTRALEENTPVPGATPTPTPSLTPASTPHSETLPTPLAPGKLPSSKSEPTALPLSHDDHEGQEAQTSGDSTHHDPRLSPSNQALASNAVNTADFPATTPADDRHSSSQDVQTTPNANDGDADSDDDDDDDDDVVPLYYESPPQSPTASTADSDSLVKINEDFYTDMQSPTPTKASTPRGADTASIPASSQSNVTGSHQPSSADLEQDTATTTTAHTRTKPTSTETQLTTTSVETKHRHGFRSRDKRAVQIGSSTTPSPSSLFSTTGKSYPLASWVFVTKQDLSLHKFVSSLIWCSYRYQVPSDMTLVTYKQVYNAYFHRLRLVGASPCQTCLKYHNESVTYINRQQQQQQHQHDNSENKQTSHTHSGHQTHHLKLAPLQHSPSSLSTSDSHTNTNTSKLQRGDSNSSMSDKNIPVEMLSLPAIYSFLSAQLQSTSGSRVSSDGQHTRSSGGNSISLSSDTGWGCMLRSAQMMLGTALIFHYIGSTDIPMQHLHNVATNQLTYQVSTSTPSPSNEATTDNHALSSPSGSSSHVSSPISSPHDDTTDRPLSPVAGYVIRSTTPALSLYTTLTPPPTRFPFPPFSLRNSIQMLFGDTLSAPYSLHAMLLHRGESRVPGEWYSPLEASNMLLHITKVARGDHTIPCAYQDAEKLFIKYDYYTFHGVPRPPGTKPFTPRQSRYILSAEHAYHPHSHDSPTSVTKIDAAATAARDNSNPSSHHHIHHKNDKSGHNDHHHHEDLDTRSPLCLARYPLLHGVSGLTVCVCYDGAIYYHSILRRMLSRGTVTPVLVLLSVCLGMNSIEPRHYGAFLSCFRLCYNVGAIGGIKHSSLYFYGAQNDRVFYLDPHTSQKALNDGDCDSSTYTCKTIQSAQIKEIDPMLSFGFYIPTVEALSHWFFNMKEFLLNHSMGGSHSTTCDGHTIRSQGKGSVSDNHHLIADLAGGGDTATQHVTVNPSRRPSPSPGPHSPLDGLEMAGSNSLAAPFATLAIDKPYWARHLDDGESESESDGAFDDDNIFGMSDSESDHSDDDSESDFTSHKKKTNTATGNNRSRQRSRSRSKSRRSTKGDVATTNDSSDDDDWVM